MTTPETGVAAFGAGTHTTHFWTPLARGYRWLAGREMLACAFVLVLTLGLRAALFPWLPVPQPMIHDEFSYLLAADTYAHGRLTNPPHPFWQHFETFYVLQQPTYASKYQPLQGLILAFGQKFFGVPWIGVYLTTGLMCAAICWMLQGWIAPEWALLGALFCALRVGVLSYWMNSYFPGSVAGLGGALALGAVARILWRKRFRQSFTWALGLTIVALSRPYDATILACATVATLLWFLCKSRTPFRTLYTQVGLPATLVLALCAATLAYNNFRVTGHLLTVPDQVYERQYAVVPMGAFSIFPLGPEPVYRHPVMRTLHVGVSIALWNYARSHPLVLLLVRIYLLVNLFFPFWALLIPVLLWPYRLKTQEERATVFLLATAMAMIAPLVSSQPHYVAVFAGLFYLRFLQSAARLWYWRPWDKPVGWALGVLLVGLLASELCYSLSARVRGANEASRLISGLDTASRVLLSQSSAFASARQAIIQALDRLPGRQLVMVRYSPEHSPHQEWVYNRADIDSSPIVWAREMGSAQDRPFLEYFQDRRVWLLEPDRSPPQLSPYPSGGSR